MSGCSPKQMPVGVVFLKRAVRAMDIILHIGAHRTGTTSFQNYVRGISNELVSLEVAFWGPDMTRKGLFPPVFEGGDDSVAEGARQQEMSPLKRQLDAAWLAGARRLIVSDENIMGGMRNNIRHAALYPQVGSRVAKFANAFGGNVSTILLSPRSLDLYWCSALAFSVKRGVPVPDLQKRATIARSYRGWRDVIAEIARALPGVAVKVLPFEAYAGRSDCFLSDAINIDGPMCRDRMPVNTSPKLPDLRRAMSARGGDVQSLPFGMGRWNPFTNAQLGALRELYADDMMWLRSGADGLATLIEDGSAPKAGSNPPRAANGKGQIDECEERRMARPG